MTAASDAPAREDAEPRADAERIAALLEEVHATAGRPTWQRIEELVGHLVGLYGRGFARLLELVDEAGALDARLASLLRADELVASLLALHGLHPEPPEARIRSVIDRARGRLGAHGIAIELVDVDARGVARVRVQGASGCGSSRASIESALRDAIEAAAPEVREVQVTVAAAERLVQIDLGRSRVAPRSEEPR